MSKIEAVVCLGLVLVILIDGVCCRVRSRVRIRTGGSYYYSSYSSGSSSGEVDIGAVIAGVTSALIGVIICIVICICYCRLKSKGNSPGVVMSTQSTSNSAVFSTQAAGSAHVNGSLPPAYDDDKSLPLQQSRLRPYGMPLQLYDLSPPDYEATNIPAKCPQYNENSDFNRTYT